MQRIAGASGSHGGSGVADGEVIDRNPPARTRSKVAAYVALTKPRIIELLLVTTVPTMVVAQEGLPPPWLMAATVLGGTLAAGAPTRSTCTSTATSTG